MKWFENWEGYHKSIFGVLALSILIYITFKDGIIIDLLTTIGFIRALVYVVVLYWIMRGIVYFQKRRKKK